MTDEQSSIAVIGAGYRGESLVRNYRQLGALRLICDSNDGLLEQLRDKYPGVETCSALDGVLAREDIRGVAVATPPETHFAIAREVLMAGKHVYVEKPLALDEEHAKELISLARRRRLTLMVGHLLHYHPAFLRLKELVSSGALGRINYIYSHRLNPGKTRREENILCALAPHDISMILSLAGEEPDSATATGGNRLDRRTADVATTHLTFPSGLQAHIFVSWLHPVKVQQMVVVGDRKMAVFDDTRPWPDKLLLYANEINRRDAIPAAAEPERMAVARVEPLNLECRHFLHCAKNGCRPVTDGQEGLQVMRVLNACRFSFDRNGTRVDLGQDGGSEKIGRSVHLPYPSEVSGPIASMHAPQSMGAVYGPLLVHHTAIIDENCEIGAGTRIRHFSHVLSNCRIGEKCDIGQNVVIGPDVNIGSNCRVQNNVSVYKGVTLEDGVFCGPSMVFTNISNPRAGIGKVDHVRPTLVRQGATLGANCTVVCGVAIGLYAFVGAGAVVTRDVPDHALVVGCPARQTGWVCACGQRLQDLECPACGKKYIPCRSGVEEEDATLRPVACYEQCH